MYMLSNAKFFALRTGISLYVRTLVFLLMSGLLLSIYSPETSAAVQGDSFIPVDDVSIDKIDIIQRQIRLLDSRYMRAEGELRSLKKSQPQIPVTIIEEVSAALLDKAALDVTVYKANLESIDIELADAKQNVAILKKNIQEINSQLNVLSVFGSRIVQNQKLNVQRLAADRQYQDKLLNLQRQRVKLLTNLKSDATSILQLKEDYLGKLNSQLKSQRILRMKQQEVRDELAFQEQQNQWLVKLNHLYTELENIDPLSDKKNYTRLEREIFHANEKASFAYTQSLIARYQDQIQQISMVNLESSSISQLHELGDKVQVLSLQLNQLGGVLGVRIDAVNRQIKQLGEDQDNAAVNPFLVSIENLGKQYKICQRAVEQIKEDLKVFRSSLDLALQQELASRSGLPTFGVKMLVDLGQEMLLVPDLAFRVVKNLAGNVMANLRSAGGLVWVIFLSSQLLLLAIFIGSRKAIKQLIHRPSEWREKINSKWLSLKWLDHTIVDLFLLISVLQALVVFSIPVASYMFFIYLAGAWFVFKSILSISRICLVESTHDNTGKDMRLYRRLRWTILIGGTLSTAAVFIYQLPLIYELKTLADRMLLLFMMVMSLMLLRHWDVVPNLIISHMEKRHPYFEKSVRLVGILIPLLMFANSVIGLLGYVNLVMTISRYEGIFLIVLFAYQVLKGLLSDAVEQLSHIVIQYSSNGWLLTEAFLKPLDRVLRVTLFLAAGALLFILYGWNKQSPIVERINDLLHYQIISVLNTVITPINIIELMVVISVFYWTAKWTREFVYRSLSGRTRDMGLRNSMAILSQYCVIVVGVFICLRVLGIDLRALAFMAGMFAFGVGLGLRDLANNFFSGFLILLERPLRVGDIIRVGELEGEVTNLGSRAVTIMTWDHVELVVPNQEIFNKSFINLTAHDNIVRCILNIKVARHDSPHLIKTIIRELIARNSSVLSDPEPIVLLREMNEVLLKYELRYYVNIKQIRSRAIVASELLSSIWEAFMLHGIKPPYPQHEVFLRDDIRFQDQKVLHARNTVNKELIEETEPA